MDDQLPQISWKDCGIGPKIADPFIIPEWPTRAPTEKSVEDTTEESSEEGTQESTEMTAKEGTVVSNRIQQRLPFVSTRIEGGEFAYSGEFPWFVHYDMVGPNLNTSCGGSIITEWWVMTASHCVDKLCVNFI